MNMQDRRTEPRLLCADLVDLEWKDKAGRLRRTVANLEDISLGGACLQVDLPIPLHATVRMTYPGGKLSGDVRYCIYREIGYFVGVQFESGSKWSQRHFKPMHLFDPRKLSARNVNRGETADDGANGATQ